MKKLFPLLVAIGTIPFVSPPANASESAAKAALPASVRLGLPAERHRWLEPLVGTWRVQMSVWPARGAPPIVSSELQAVREWILGGRYLREELVGTFASAQVSRVALIGFNNLDERFELTTVDSFEPGQMWYASHEPGRPGALMLHGTSTEAGMGAEATGRKRDLRFMWEFGDRSGTQRIYVKYPGEPEFLFVEQRFTAVPDAGPVAASKSAR